MVKSWIKAFRLRTLPLAASGIIVGSAVAEYKGGFSVPVFILALVTSFLLQILSNLANDYGDSENGIDNDNRVGPQRTVQSGAISLRGMKKAMYLFAVLSLLSGIALLIVAFENISVKMLLFFVTGVVGIIAALKYTVGKSNFGYKGLGDLVVFVFFGPVAVFGVFFLHTLSLDYSVFIPASAIGLLSSGVLNVNNMRDYENDKVCGKNTLVVKIGLIAGKAYHTFLIMTSLALVILYFVITQRYSMLILIPFVLLVAHLVRVLIAKEPAKLDKELSRLAISTFIVSLVIGLVYFS